MADTKTITVEEDGALTIEQTSQVDEGVEMSASGFRLNTGMGWGVDIAVVLVVVALLYIGKKFVDKRFNSKEATPVAKKERKKKRAGKKRKKKKK